MTSLGHNAEWETKFLEHSPENICPFYILYKIPLALANFLLVHLKIYLHWWALVSFSAMSYLSDSTYHRLEMRLIYSEKIYTRDAAYNSDEKGDHLTTEKWQENYYEMTIT